MKHSSKVVMALCLMTLSFVTRTMPAWFKKKKPSAAPAAEPKKRRWGRKKKPSSQDVARVAVALTELTPAPEPEPDHDALRRERQRENRIMQVEALRVKAEQVAKQTHIVYLLSGSIPFGEKDHENPQSDLFKSELRTLLRQSEEEIRQINSRTKLREYIEKLEKNMSRYASQLLADTNEAIDELEQMTELRDDIATQANPFSEGQEAKKRQAQHLANKQQFEQLHALKKQAIAEQAGVKQHIVGALQEQLNEKEKLIAQINNLRRKTITQKPERPSFDSMGLSELSKTHKLIAQDMATIRSEIEALQSAHEVASRFVASELKRKSLEDERLQDQSAFDQEMFERSKEVFRQLGAMNIDQLRRQSAFYEKKIRENDELSSRREQQARARQEHEAEMRRQQEEREAHSWRGKMKRGWGKFKSRF